MNENVIRSERHSSDRDRLAALVAALLADALDANERLELNKLLREKEESREDFVAMVTQARLIAARLGPELRALPSDQLSDEPAKQRTIFPAAVALRSVGRTAAALKQPVFWSILAVGLVFYGSFALISWNLWPDKLPSGTDGNDANVAIISGERDVRWAAGFASKADYEQVKASEPLRLESGNVDIRLANGVSLRIEGPAAWTIERGNRATLQSGRLTADVPRRAIGFTVETPAARVVDLGTQFGVHVDASARTDVTVFKGEVLLAAVEPQPNASDSTRDVITRRLTANQASSVVPPKEKDGRAEIEDLAFDREPFARLLPMEPRPGSASRASTLSLPDGVLLITPSIVSVNSEHFGGGQARGRFAVNVVNGSGLTAGPSGILGAYDSTQDNRDDTVWHQATQGNGRDTFISFNLGATYDLRLTRIWNYNHSNNLDQGAKDIEIWTSADDRNYDLLTTVTLRRGDGTAADRAQDFATPARNVKYVKFVIPTDHDVSGQGWKILSEVRFEGVAASEASPTRIARTAASTRREGQPFRGPIPLERLFGFRPVASLDEAMATDTYAATPRVGQLGIQAVFLGDESVKAIAPGLQFNFANLGWAPSREGKIANGGLGNANPIRTKKPFTDVRAGRKSEAGIGMHADALVTFDLDEIRAAAMAPKQAYRFVCDRAGINGPAFGMEYSSVNLVVLVASKNELLAGSVNGERVSLEIVEDVWRVVTPTNKPLRADGTFVRFDLELPPHARYLTLATTDAGDDVHADHAAWSGAQLEMTESTR